MDHQSDNASIVSSHGEDTFDDAPEMTPRPSSTNQGRSLMGRTSSISGSSQKTSSPRPESRETVPQEDDEDKTTDEDVNGDKKKEEDAKEDEDEFQDVEQEEDAPDKSPLLTTHRVSMSSMDDVNLEGGEKSPETTRSSMMSQPPKLPPRNSTASMASIAPDPVPSEDETPTKSPPERPPPPPGRKITSPFAWLSRNKEDKRTSSPPTRSNRDTVSSINTIGSNPDLMLSHLEHNEDGGNKAGNRTSLRDRFKFLRMREEAGITTLDEEAIPAEHQSGGALAGLIGRSTSFGLAIGTPTHSADEKKEIEAKDEASSPGLPSPGLARQPTVNLNLAPGTVSGMSVGPATDAQEVDWDLWQNVVYEGPQAVARTSPEELNKAIASGIPQAIRGVVWQVMAQSKNDELEVSYRELVARGTDKEKPILSKPNPRSSLQANGHTPNGGNQKESMTSSRSSMRSIRSGYSTPATTAASTHQANSSPPAEEQTPSATPVTDSMEEVEKKLKEEKDSKAKETVAIQKLEKVIKRDLGARTSYSKYIASAGLQDGLFGICKAYALYDEEVGYAQGMNFIAMPLLFNMPEEEAFTLFVRLMNHYGLRDLFVEEMPGLHLHLYQFARLLEDFEPALYCHLNRRSVHPQLYATQWFLTLFAYRFPLQLVLRIYDLILSEGLEGAILKFGIVLMQKNAQALMGMNDMSQLTTYLKERLFDVYIDKAPSANSILESGFFGATSGTDKEVYRADMLVQDACSVKITPAMIKTYTVEWQEQRAAEKEREAELESLRTNVHRLTGKVRVLEDSLTKSDTEHAEAATELVRTKVQNQELIDENDSLKGQVTELKKIVDTQPAEVEERLKEETDRVLKRNVEVQGQNRMLEDQMAEMEKDLVETKMQYAQIHSEYETLKQRWNNVSTMLQGQ